MKVYEPGEKAIYEEDDARAIVEVKKRTVEGDTLTYELKVIKPLNNSNPIFVPVEYADKRAIVKGSYVRGFKPGQEFIVNKNIAARGLGSCWGMWTLTDIVDDTLRRAN